MIHGNLRGSGSTSGHQPRGSFTCGGQVAWTCSSCSLGVVLSGSAGTLFGASLLQGLQTLLLLPFLLVTTGEAAAEPLLLQTFRREDDDLREAAAIALGHAGTATAVPALQEATEHSWLDRPLRRAVRQETGEIQSHL